MLQCCNKGLSVYRACLVLMPSAAALMHLQLSCLWMYYDHEMQLPSAMHQCCSKTVFVQDALGVDAFSCSSDALAAEALLDAYKSGDESAIRKVIASKPVFQDLDNQASVDPYLGTSASTC